MVAKHGIRLQKQIKTSYSASRNVRPDLLRQITILLAGVQLLFITSDGGQRQHVEKYRLKFHEISCYKRGINKSVQLNGTHYVNSRRDNARKIRPFQCRINVFKYSFFPNTIKSWDTLPSDAVTANNFQATIEDFVFQPVIATQSQLCCFVARCCTVMLVLCGICIWEPPTITPQINKYD